jgi:HAD superfamily hydrolase (TIGR01509 family)
MIDLVIFDCDGVLVDSERLAVKVDVELMAQLGWHLSEAEAVETFVGVSDASFRSIIETKIGRKLPADWEAQTQPLYRNRLATSLTPVDGIVEALDRITLTTCVASSGTHDKMRFTLGRTGLFDRFDGRIFSATQVARGKPAPDLFLFAAAQMGVAPTACAVVEDSAFGVAAARAAGMRVLAYAGGVTPAAKLVGPGTTVFGDMPNLPNLLDDLARTPGGNDQ